ncbi:Protein of uncharacterised function (DUF2530) [Rhodococcus gordoniae]|uniref:Protein of uncharacterized function (DUF2530) n=1 Tax=Rhodococcus gordoniae TaxID=223392 RepID=A0A379M3A0_9NOCA|nr:MULTISPECIES: DUF2530 domain-containing protein [Rhodococcus]UTT49379.1 DUF2530 domain-containing protein [Rhodococcus gordoniae]SUE16791.1 Protein of uncharacterised function (DUF2530) [Rhodococcus gordoniae]
MEPAQLVAARIRRLADPRPALAVGTALWVVATVVVLWVGGDLRDDALPICVAGILVGLLGTALFLLQRRAARRGDRGAQVGLD